VEDDWMECAVFIGTEKVVPTKERQGIGSAYPCVQEKEYKVLWKKV
jgi:hypothetical protein